MQDKTPSYLYNVPWAPRNFCQATPLPRQKVVVLLRDPVARAYSSFFKSFRGAHGVSKTRDGFTSIAEIDVAVANECGDLIFGESLEDFEACCKTALSAFDSKYKPWMGCTVQGQGGFEISHGDKRLAPIRGSIYHMQLRHWYRYVHPHDVLLFKSADLFAAMDDVAREITEWVNAGPRVPWGQDPSEVPAQISQGAHKGVRHNHMPQTDKKMLEQTKQLLQSFFAPHNKKLEELVGREMHW